MLPSFMRLFLSLGRWWWVKVLYQFDMKMKRCCTLDNEKGRHCVTPWQKTRQGKPRLALWDPGRRSAKEPGGRYLFHSLNVAITYIIRLLIRSISSSYEGGITSFHDPRRRPRKTNRRKCRRIRSLRSVLFSFLVPTWERLEEKIKFAR